MIVFNRLIDQLGTINKRDYTKIFIVIYDLSLDIMFKMIHTYTKRDTFKGELTVFAVPKGTCPEKYDIRYLTN